MNLLFKKYFWAVKLVGIALLAFFVAGGVNDWVASKLFLVPAPPTIEVPADGAEQATDAAWGRVRTADAASILQDRLIFSLDPPVPPVVEPPPAAEEPDEEEEPPMPDGELEDSELPIDLIGTLVVSDAAHSMATLQVEGANKLGWIGTDLLDGRARIAAIAPRHIVIAEGNRHTVVRLWAEKGAGSRPAPARPGVGAARPAPVPPPRAVDARPAPVSPADRTERAARIRDGVKKTGAYDFEVSRSMLDAELSDLARLQAEARVVPHYENQKYEGFKLVGVRPGSLYRALGIRSGDVIKSVNGVAIDSPNKALELFQQLQNSSNIRVDVERRGQQQTLSYNVQ